MKNRNDLPQWYSNLFDKQKQSDEVIDIIEKNHRFQSADFAVQRLLKLENLMIKRYDGAIYLGQVVQNQRNGKGVLFYSNGRVYEGDWMNDNKFGLGIEKFSNGNMYEGQYVDNKPQGKGKYVWANGEQYDGQWQEGKKHGLGCWQGLKGDYYMGEWQHGQTEGYGVHVWINGDRYEGQFKNNLKNGDGREIFKNGDIYTGNYKNGKPNGYGVYQWKNGAVYKGDFLDGMRNGYGSWTRQPVPGQTAEEKYSGQYKGDRKSGLGIYQWQNGNLYLGYFQDDFRNGLGVMQWSDESEYKGYWLNGLQQGMGLLKVQNQEQIFAFFERGEPVHHIKNASELRDLNEKVKALLQELDSQGKMKQISLQSVNKRGVSQSYTMPAYPRNQTLIQDDSDASFHKSISQDKKDKKLPFLTRTNTRSRQLSTRRQVKSNNQSPYSPFYTQEGQFESSQQLNTTVEKVTKTKLKIDFSKILPNKINHRSDTSLENQQSQQNNQITKILNRRKYWVPSGSVRKQNV